jgi:hypothetical protein
VKVLVDTNVVFDVIERGQPHYSASNQVLCLARHGAVMAAVASHTIANCFYRYGPGVLPFLRERLLQHCAVAAGDAEDLLLALGWGFKDLEDAMQAAAGYNFGASFVLTRNVRDFRRSPIPAILPHKFLSRFGY